ncbi:hypothetical protein HMPREF0631_1383 [Peptostreptococcus anaerobius 653-L]|uniref:Uncharacterized protein n=2 Tax=Peptostreptococcus anaerobius TaxID=1261 RepID=D3MU77_9FIRM|nr:hypothetical protein HMPREF0631_1383 [Peptostreptococcus anaerobius 653-L]
MYLMFKEKNIMPSVTYGMKRGERKIATAFLREEIEERNKANEEMEKGFG